MLPSTHALGLDPGRLDTALTAACRAPSLHNSQPWRFRVGPDVIELWADPERVLPAADPEGREQQMACGAALLTLRLALRAALDEGAWLHVVDDPTERVQVA